jgi:light-harvesting complex 1 beta chain
VAIDPIGVYRADCGAVAPPDVLVLGQNCPSCAGRAQQRPQGHLRRSVRMSTRTSISGLTDDEAQEFHQYWIQGTVAFTAVAVIAHLLVWAWKPWF